jgi:protocatechuate 3,4-dioxygenase beta subunit
VAAARLKTGGNRVLATIMKKALIAVPLLVGLSLLVLLPASIFAPSVLSTSALAAPAPQFGRAAKEDTKRLLTGKVLDGGDNPLPNAVVYLTNTQTRAVKTYIVGADGAYRFPALQPSIDYEVYAQYNNRKSHTKTVSQFDDRTQVYLSLKIDAK